MAGDWRLYLEALAAPDARVAYVAAPLNIHRRHAASVTHSLKAQSHIDEVADIHRWLQDRGATPSSIAAAQRAYLVELKQQFGLAAAAAAPAVAAAWLVDAAARPQSRGRSLSPP